MARLVDIRTRLQRICEDTSGGFAIELDGMINEAQHEILAEWAWRFMQKEEEGRTYEGYSTGTLAVTRGSSTITLTGGTWHKGYEGGWVAVPNNATGQWFRIYSIDSTTMATLENPYQGATDSGLTYVVYQDRYHLPYDCKKITLDTLIFLDGVNPLIPISRQVLQQAHADTPETTGVPRFYIDDFVSKTNLWNTGNVDTTNGSSTLPEGSTPTDWGNAVLTYVASPGGDVLEGLPIVFTSVVGYQRVNGVRDVTAATSLELEEDFEGITSTNVSYVIGPKRSRLVQFFPIPSANVTYRFIYKAMPIRLQDDNDQIMIPDDFAHVLVHRTAADALLQVATADDILKAQWHSKKYRETLFRMKQWDAQNPDRTYSLRYYGLPHPERPAAIDTAEWQVSGP